MGSTDKKSEFVKGDKFRKDQLYSVEQRRRSIQTFIFGIYDVFTNKNTIKGDSMKTRSSSMPLDSVQ